MKQFSKNNKKLGRGISALLGETKLSATGRLVTKKGLEIVASIKLSKIRAGVYQPRTNFKEEELQELANSIIENGIIQPIILRKVDEEDNYEIIAGERRFRAAKIAGLEEVPTIVKKINNHEALELALIENIQRSDLSVIEEALSYQKLIDEFAYSQQQIATKVGKSRSHVTNLLRLLKLPKEVQKLLEKNELSMGHARAIIKSDNPEQLAKLAVSQNLTVRQIEDLSRDEKVINNQNTLSITKSESQVKYVDNNHLSELENQLSNLLKMESKIHYNAIKNNGKITIKFSDFDKIQDLINKLT